MRSGYLIGSIIAATLLLWALADHAYGYIITMRWIVCGVSVWGMFIFIRRRRPGWLVALAIIGLLFNPFLPARLPRAMWIPINVVAALIVLGSAFAGPKQATSVRRSASAPD